MKKAIWIFIILFAFSSPRIEAQEHYAANISVGVKAGASLSRAMFSPGVKQGFLPGTTGGLMLRYIEENHFGLIAEINYIDRGWKESFDELPFAFSRRLSYLQIPLLAHIYFGSDRAKFFFNAGPEIGFMIGESTSANFDFNDIENLPADFPIERLHIIGGGSQNKYLNRLTALATGLEVEAGPVEATAIGNILVQTLHE